MCKYLLTGSLSCQYKLPKPATKAQLNSLFFSIILLFNTVITAFCLIHKYEYDVVSHSTCIRNFHLAMDSSKT